MPKKSKIVNVCKEDFENKLRVEKWMKRNASGQVTIDRDATPNDILNNKSNEHINNRQSYNCKSDEIKYNILKRKVGTLSLPIESTEKHSVNKPIDIDILNKQLNPVIETKQIASKISKNSSCNVEWTTNNMKVHEIINGKSSPEIQCNTAKIPSLAQSQNIENETYSKSSLKYLLCKEKDADVYTSLLENYRYLITPKSWSVTEFTSETKNRYVVFFNVHVIMENNTLISVMRKSLIIDKGAAINYSVHGLPVDINGTILPKTLDNTKKLLSILHIFDKMQVCDGLGSDLNIMQTDFVFKDNCRFWRHKHCKVILIKAMRCLICTETRNLLLQSKIIFKEEDDSLDFITIKKTKAGSE